MRWSTAVAAASLVIVLSAAEAKAQTITLKSVDTSTAKQITVNAEITNLPKGWTISSVLMFAPPTGGAAGEGGEKAGVDSGGGVWTGTMSTGFITGNEYDVRARLEAKDPMGKIHTYYSAKQTEKVK